MKLKFGDKMIDVLAALGNPNKDFRDDSMIFLNYLELGMDLGFNDYGDKLEKIVLHTNHLKDSFFSFYDRCYFELET